MLSKAMKLHPVVQDFSGRGAFSVQLPAGPLTRTMLYVTPALLPVAHQVCAFSWGETKGTKLTFMEQGRLPDGLATYLGTNSSSWGPAGVHCRYEHLGRNHHLCFETTEMWLTPHFSVWKKKGDNSILQAKDEWKVTFIHTRPPEEIPITNIISCQSRKNHQGFQFQLPAAWNNDVINGSWITLVVISWEEPDTGSILLNYKLLITAFWKSIYKHSCSKLDILFQRNWGDQNKKRNYFSYKGAFVKPIKRASVGTTRYLLESRRWGKVVKWQNNPDLPQLTISFHWKSQ